MRLFARAAVFGAVHAFFGLKSAAFERLFDGSFLRGEISLTSHEGPFTVMEEDKENAMMVKSLKQAFMSLALVLTFALPGCQHAPVTAASPAVTPVASLDGFAWETSAPQSKLDFLLGVECALAMESALAQAAREKGETVQLSLFANGWQIAFHDTTRPELVHRIDEFYYRNPDQKNRHVFDVIWTEMVAPAVSAGARK